MLKTGALIRRLRANADVFASLVAGVEQDQACWKPSPDEWSILEVVRHLADEEVEDFRARVEATLHRPGAVWPPIDPPRWAVERAYNSGTLSEALESFLERRKESVAWLADLEGADWTVTHEHPLLGLLSAGDLLTSWLAHDLIHIRQLARLQRQYLVSVLSPCSPDYAGRW